jgi:hypothetical protein
MASASLHEQQEDESALTVVNESVLVPDSSSLVLGGVLLVENILENILESSIIFLQDGVLGAQIQGPFLLQSELEAGLGKTHDGFIGVVHSHGNSSSVVKIKDGIHNLQEKGHN